MTGARSAAQKASFARQSAFASAPWFFGKWLITQLTGFPILSTPIRFIDYMP